MHVFWTTESHLQVMHELLEENDGPFGETFFRAVFTLSVIQLNEAAKLSKPQNLPSISDAAGTAMLVVTQRWLPLTSTSTL
jgi:hypothetical protein